MLAKRVIPCLDVSHGRVVKGMRFLELRDAGDPINYARMYEAQGADELVILDIAASSNGEGTLASLIEQVSEECFTPLTVGGGIRSIADVRVLLLAGADKVSVNTSAILSPNLIREIASEFGSQCVTVAIDVQREPGF